MAKIVVKSETPLINDENLDIMIGACNLLLPEVCKAWEVMCPQVVKGDNPSPGDWFFKFIDQDPNVPGAEAYHTETNDVILGFVLAKTILDNGGFILFNEVMEKEMNGNFIHASPYATVAGAFFHEVCEALIDDTVDIWWVSYSPLICSQNCYPTFSNGITVTCAEICDPVQQNYIVVEYQGHKVGMSDFVLPAWKDGQNTTGPYNYINSLQYPFQVDNGGYAVVLTGDGGCQQIFSKEIPEWVANMKRSSHRFRKISQRKKS